jgi:hypothetical protein
MDGEALQAVGLRVAGNQMTSVVSRLVGCTLGVVVGYWLYSTYGGRYFTTPQGWVLDGMSGTMSRGAYRHISFDSPRFPVPPVPSNSIVTGESVDTAAVEEFQRLCNASRDRAFARHPRFADPGGISRKRLDDYVTRQFSRTERQHLFVDPRWPEAIVEEYVKLSRPDEP